MNHANSPVQMNRKKATKTVVTARSGARNMANAEKVSGDMGRGVRRNEMSDARRTGSRRGGRIGKKKGRSTARRGEKISKKKGERTMRSGEKTTRRGGMTIIDGPHGMSSDQLEVENVEQRNGTQSTRWSALPSATSICFSSALPARVCMLDSRRSPSASPLPC